MIAHRLVSRIASVFKVGTAVARGFIESDVV
jgi:hypothetical protein